MVGADSCEVSRASHYSGDPVADAGFRVPAFHRLWRGIPSSSPIRCPTTSGPYNPRRQAFWFGLFRFRSPLLTESILFLFLRLLRCFTSAGVTLPFLCVQKGVMQYYLHWVAPFGNPRVKAYLPLTEAYRSLSRPSSPVDTKASTNSIE